jgi:hypothetical protein
MKQKVDIDPKSIDLKEAYCMCSHRVKYAQPESEGKPLTCMSDEFPLVIDFDDFEKIEPPEGYEIAKPRRDITVKISTFVGYCAGAKHYYCDLKFRGPTLRNKKDDFVYSFGKPIGCGVGDIFGLHKIELYRRLTEKDLADKNIDWDYYDVGDMTHRWNDAENAIACAKKVIALRFKNYGKISVVNET